MTRGVELNNEAHLFPDEQLPPPSPEQAEKISKLAQIKDDFSNAVLEFRALLKDPTLAQNKSQLQKDRSHKVFQELNRCAGELERYNAGEGVFSLLFIALNSCLTLKEEINDVRFQNLMLHKKIKQLEEQSTGSSPVQGKE